MRPKIRFVESISDDVPLSTLVSVKTEKPDDDTLNNEGHTETLKEALPRCRMAVREILYNSNATPLYIRTPKGFKCWYCTDFLQSPADLKSHIIERHTGDIINFKKKDSAARFYVKLDITQLHCKICKEEIDTIELFIEHLNNVHNKKIYSDVKKYIFPFKFDSEDFDEFRCCLCSKIFTAFKMLQMHMHSHYKNFFCNLCPEAFVNYYTLEQHKSSAHPKFITIKKTTAERSSKRIVVKKEPGDKEETSNVFKMPAKYLNLIMKRIMTNSNATPIRNHNGNAFMCSFCSEEFPNPAALKLHTTPSHIKRFFNRFMDKIISTKYYVKMDITYLQCSICSQDAANIEQLIEHLNEAHLANSKILPEISKLIFPFKFPNHEFKCCICSNVFDNFKTLTQHMHVHFSNFYCSYCAAGFITKTCLYVHERSHLAGPFKCTLCELEFNTEVKKKRHEAIAHETKYTKNRNICRVCNARFSDYHKKYRHMVIDHGMKSLAHKCKSCDKDFATKCAMLAHVKRFHLMLKPHKCTMCEMAFYSTAELNKHMNKHTGLMPKRFKCELCPKAFIRMYTLKEHMRSHLNDRRFKCHLCGQAFVQRCSLKSHMMNKHDAVFNSSSASYHPTPSPC